MSHMLGLGLGPALARKILQRYGDDSVRLLREDPYLIAEEVRGVGFRTADKVGAAAGIAPDDPRRAAGAVLHLVGRGADEGHVFVTRAELTTSAAELEVPPGRIDAAVGQLEGRGLLVVEGDAVYAPPLHAAECSAARRLKALAGVRRGARRAPVPADLGFEPTAEQLAAVRATLEHGLVVITGGPGTGKTTTVRAIVAAHEAAGHAVLLCAPTGRAAKRLSEATGREGRTIHRALEWNPGTGRFRRGASSPLAADLVLVDEASMLDVRLADDLFSAVSPRATLVLVGDVDQLPPVGPGQTLRDVITSGIAPVVRLGRVFRQARQSAIVRAAHGILAGRVPEPTPAGTRGPGDLFLVPAKDPDAVAAKLVATLQRITAAYGLDVQRDVQVLSPMRRGPAGTHRLNEIMQAELNPAPSGGAAGTGIRVGDKVMQLRNDYDRDVFNGDFGTVRRFEGGMAFVEIEGRLVQYDRDALEDLTLAYASTVHKVQGSEFPAVVVVLHMSHYVLLSRSLLYTAVTRARHLVVLVGEERAVRHAARNAVSHRANSRLVERLGGR